jgi:hypothetical protein
VRNIPSKSRDLADENKSFDGMEMNRNNVLKLFLIWQCMHVVTRNTDCSIVERIFYIFCKKHISIKLFYLYQRFQFTDNYFFKIKFVLFLYLLLSALWG